MWQLQEGATTPGFGGMKGTNRDIKTQRLREVRSVELRGSCWFLCEDTGWFWEWERKLASGSRCCCWDEAGGSSKQTGPRDLPPTPAIQAPSSAPFWHNLLGRQLTKERGFIIKTECRVDNSFLTYASGDSASLVLHDNNPRAATQLPVLENKVQFSSVAQSCLTLCDPMNCSTPGLPVHHQLPEFTQIHVHRASDAI